MVFNVSGLEVMRMMFEEDAERYAGPMGSIRRDVVGIAMERKTPRW